MAVTFGDNLKPYWQTDEGALRQNADTERNNRIYEEWLAGLPVRDLAFRYNLSKSTIRRIISERREA